MTETDAQRIDELSRALADQINDREAFKRRLERERDRQLEVQRQEVASVLLEAVEELERALAADRTGPPGSLATGVGLIVSSLQRRVGDLGLERIETVGARFDPALHEAVDVVPVEGARDGLVIDEVRPGWRTRDRVVKPAKVLVGRAARGVAAPGRLAR